MTGKWIEAVFTCSFCAHETRLTIATQSSVEGLPLTCSLCGGEMGRLSDGGPVSSVPFAPKKPDEANQ